VLKIDDETYKFVHSEKTFSNGTKNTFYMPWFENSKSLNNGAIILPLNS
jgi:hypothetical protein